MASWITAQLKAAEGLLEAVDKTVSRTVGTLGLAEGDSEQLTPEYGVSRPTAGFHQAAPAAATQGLQPYSSPYPSSASNLAGIPGASGLGPAASNSYYYYNSSSSSNNNSAAAAAPLPWGTRAATAAAFPGSGLSSLAPASTGYHASAGAMASAGFTVKTDAPIPFGGPPAPALSGVPEPGGPSASRGGGPAPTAGGGEAEASAAAASAREVRPLPTSTAAAAGPYEALAATAPQVSGTGAIAPPLHAPRGVAGYAAASAGPAIGAVGAGAGHGAVTGPFPTEGAAAVAAPGGSATGEAAGGEMSPPASPASQEGSAPEERSSKAGAAATAAAPAAAPPPPVPMQAGVAPGSPPRAASATATTPAKGAAAAAAAVMAEAASSAASATAISAAPSAPQHQQPLAGAGAASPAPVAALASATTAAASSLASATSSAVTHSLSFFNLVLEDAPDSAAVAAAAAAAAAPDGAAQQVAALSRTCDQLRKRLEASRVENEQLEDMLARAEVRAQQEAALVATLREEVAAQQQARAAAEGSLAAQLAVARAAAAEAGDRYEASQRAVLVLEGRLAALEESSRRLMEQHSDREGGMVEALRTELAAAESRLAAESRAHAAARSAAAARELELEQQIGDSTAALADLTRGLEEANRKARGLEEELVVAARGRNDLTAQLAALQRQLEDAGIEPLPSEGAARGPSAAAAAAAAAAAELEVLRGELAQHQRAAALARQAAEASQAQAASLAAEVEALRQSAEQRQDTAQLEAQLREVSDMLYLKQTQMERLAAEKAAQQLKTERELENVRQELAKLARQAVGQGGGGGGRGGDPGFGPSSASPSTHDVIPMDALGEPYQRLVRHNRVGRAVKAAANFLDGTASTTSFVLRQYPLARLAVFAYALLIHLYVYLLIARMQRLATHYEAAAVAPSTGA